MNNQDILSEIVIKTKYARYYPELERKETTEELFERNKKMMLDKYPALEQEINEVWENYVKTFKVMPSMRSLQYGGLPIFQNPSRLFNCSFLHIKTPKAFSETIFLLLSGCGVGYSVQKHHVRQLPKIKKPTGKRTFLIEDSIIGWAEAVRVLVDSYFEGKREVVFDYDQIRKQGQLLKTSGGRAPGPQPLKVALEKVREIFNNAIGRKLTTLECHDIQCHLADCVVAGDNRRSAMIALFSFDDEEMLNCKNGPYWEHSPQRGRANNSVIMLRDLPWDKTLTGIWKSFKRNYLQNAITYTKFERIWRIIQNSGTGEPGVFLTDDLEYGGNPCVEISLRDQGFCNLTETNVDDVNTQEELEARVRAAAFIGTLQAGFTKFIYLRDTWEKNAEEEALLGVSLTGLGSGSSLHLDFAKAAEEVKKENIRVAKIIRINPGARLTCVKPSGSAACVLKCSSGVHAYHNDYYIRRMRVGKKEGIYKYILEKIPALVEDLKGQEKTMAVIAIPIKAPEGALTRHEGLVSQLDRVLKMNKEWVAPGHVSGPNKHNVSSTIYIKEDEWDYGLKFFWENRAHYTGMSVLPYDGGVYEQTPFEDITKEKYEELTELLRQVDFSDIHLIKETEDTTNYQQEAACSGGVCSI